MLTFLINPFEKVGGFTSLFIGLVGIFVTALIFHCGGALLAGLLQIGLNPGIGLAKILFCGIVVWLVPSSIFYSLGKLFSASKIRAVDVFGMIAFAQLPFVLVALLMAPSAAAYVLNVAVLTAQSPVDVFTDPRFVFGLTLVILSMFPFAWVLILMFKALQVACNLKGGRQWGIYFGGLVGGDILVRIILYFLVFAALMAPLELEAKDSAVDSAFAGRFEGTLNVPGNPLRFAVEIRVENGEYVLIARSPDQGNAPMPVSDFSIKSGKLEFKIPNLNISYQGKFDGKKDKISGTFFQGVRIPLTMERKAVEAKKENIITDIFTGRYEGVLNFQSQRLRFVLELSKEGEVCKAVAFSPDQSDAPIPINEFYFASDKCRFAIEKLGIIFEGSANNDATEIKGRFTQFGQRLQLTLKKK
jgi:hypothetical protein